MKIVIPCYNYLLDEKLIFDGGSVWLNNLRMAFKKLGHDCDLVPLDWKGEADIMICQSEWAETEAWLAFRGKKVGLLGHFIKNIYPDPHKIEADLFLTTWKGNLLEGFKAEFVPHAFNSSNAPGDQSRTPTEIVWLGNTYDLRKEDWFEGLEISRYSGVDPKLLNHMYAGQVCPNIHAGCQMGEVEKDLTAYADKPGYMLNERFWQVIGSGGILIQQYHPQVLDFFKEDEIIMCKTKEEFQEKCRYFQKHPDEGIEFYKRAREVILEKHTYVHRSKEILKLLNDNKTSVIVTCYNKGKFIGETIESLLNQTHKPYEIIIIDDGSTDNSADVIRKYGNSVDYRYQTNKGVTSARNRGLELATGDYFILIDGDDKLHPTYIERCSAEIGNHDICYTDFEGIGEWVGLHHYPHPFNKEHLKTAQVFPSVMALYSMRLRDQGARFEDVLAEDYYWWCDLVFKRNYNVVHIPECLCYYRRTTGSRVDQVDLRRDEANLQLMNEFRDFGVQPIQYKG